MMLTLRHGNNLDMLDRLARAGERFDLVELDGPYMAGLEDWDTLTEDQYVEHYAARLSLVRQVLQPWGVVFVFGYPEGCAEIKAWARQTGTLHLRRWLTWYKQRTAHKGRKVESILLFGSAHQPELEQGFKALLTRRRVERRLKIVDVCRATGINAHLAHKVGGWLWFENIGAPLPSVSEYARLKAYLDIPDYFDPVAMLGSYEGLTNLDYLSATYPEDTRDLGDSGLRSKPIGLYHDLFRPVVPPRDDKRALILYGGSGNAGIAAGQLGYDVTMIEQDARRCEVIQRRWDWYINRKDSTPVSELGPLFQEIA